MELNWISTIRDMPTVKSVRFIPVLLRLTNFYHSLLQIYAKVALPQMEILKK